MKLLITILILFTFFSCQKELTTFPKTVQKEHVTEVAALPIDTVRRDDTIWVDPTPEGYEDDDHSGKMVAFITEFEVLYDTAAVKEVLFLITRSSGCALSTAILYIDGLRYKTIDITTATDTIRFFMTHAKEILPQYANRKGKHTIALRIRGNGNTGEYYKADLVGFHCLWRYHLQQIYTVNSKQPGIKMIYQ